MRSSISTPSPSSCRILPYVGPRVLHANGENNDLIKWCGLNNHICMWECKIIILMNVNGKLACFLICQAGVDGGI